MISGGTAWVGMRVMTPDGEGKIVKVINPDVAMVEFTSKDKIINPKTKELSSVVGRFDLSEMRAIDKPLPVPGSPEALAASEENLPLTTPTPETENPHQPNEPVEETSNPVAA